MIIAYTDGGIMNNGKEDSYGAYAFTIQNGDSYKEHSKALDGGTNQTFELRAVIMAIYYCSKMKFTEDLLIKTDSKYVIGCATEWMDSWRMHGYQNSKKQLKNRGLIMTLDKVMRDYQGDISFEHVKGHNGEQGNERVDTLCTESMKEFDAVRDNS